MADELFGSILEQNGRVGQEDGLFGGFIEGPVDGRRRLGIGDDTYHIEKQQRFNA